MGLLKKIFKPVSKVLDKIVPNEIKPFLPYAAAFAPYMMPGIMGIGGNTMLSRALMSGALNIGGQLAQEGSDGDINLLSAGLGALQGAMTAPGSLSRSMHPTQGVVTHGQPGSAGILAAKAKGMEPGMMKSGLEALGKGSKYLTGAAETLQDNPFSVPGLKAAAIPFAQGTADVMYAEGQRDLKDLAKDVVDDMGGGYTDDAYRAAIRKSMTAYGATEEEIIDAIEAAGYRSGGRVGLLAGGEPTKNKEADFISMSEVVENVDGDKIKESLEVAEGYKLSDFEINDEAARYGLKLYNLKNDPEAGNFEEDEVRDMIWGGKYAKGGRINKAEGGVPSVLPKGVEADYRGGGFIPIGSKERADDVPARLSENEFVMTADAVRAAGGGSVNQGAKRMYNLMHNLEARA